MSVRERVQGALPVTAPLVFNPLAKVERATVEKGKGA